ncbi:MAG: hypothetical protein JXR34_05575, partial [Bacteroidales bacterium]|nr:hypothetical protein [Bacteroidales bacterium]
FQLSAFSPISFGTKKDSTQKSLAFGSDFKSLEEGSLLISAGYGALNYFKNGIRQNIEVIDDNTTGLGPLHGKIEYMLTKTLGSALLINHVETNGNVVYDDGLGKPYTVTLHHKSTSIIYRLNWHFYNEDGLDLFIGGGLGYRFGKYNYATSYSKYSPPLLTFVHFPIGFEFSVGFRYFISNHFGFYSEIGITKSILQTGLTYKL